MPENERRVGCTKEIIPYMRVNCSHNVPIFELMVVGHSHVSPRNMNLLGVLARQLLRATFAKQSRQRQYPRPEQGRDTTHTSLRAFLNCHIQDHLFFRVLNPMKVGTLFLINLLDLNTQVASWAEIIPSTVYPTPAAYNVSTSDMSSRSQLTLRPRNSSCRQA